MFPNTKDINAATCAKLGACEIRQELECPRKIIDLYAAADKGQ